MHELYHSTLVLNKNWQAIRIVSSKRAIVTVCRGVAEVLCPDTYIIYEIDNWIIRSEGRQHQLPLHYFIRTPSIAIERPEIIILKNYDEFPLKEITFNRRNLLKRDNHQCQYCGRWLSSSSLSIDHIVPQSKGGRTDWLNCVSCCYNCNVKKADRTLRESGLALLNEPTIPKWAPIYSFIPNCRPPSWDKFLPKHRI